jgi:hypothetical protein
MQKRANFSAVVFAVGLATLGALFCARSGPLVGAAKVSANVVALHSECRDPVSRKDALGC